MTKNSPEIVFLNSRGGILAIARDPGSVQRLLDQKRWRCVIAGKRYAAGDPRAKAAALPK